ncbi:MAG: aspartate aminotransferase family protein [Ectothiorhodospiraceae bacterium]|nr:aspartate aminotransferase family protein [Ectothiorhodospiraceae bacterium]
MTQASMRNLTLDAAVADAEARFVAANPESQARYERATRSMPGANTRTVLHYDPFPVTLVKGEGAWVTDLDGHRYLDFLGEYTAGLYGHSEPAILDAIRGALEGGLVLGGPNKYETRLAELMCERFPAVDMVRFCNSGTEGNMMCLSLARAITGRDLVMVFSGGYHGGLYSFAGGEPSPMNAPIESVIAEYNDIDGATRLIAEHGPRLAAVILEPMMGGGGCIPADREFLQALREATERTGTLLIFDEVMTSRLAPGGLHALHGITPDLVSFGKYLGGGVTFGAFGGRMDLMARLDPRRPDALTHSGTYNNNVLTMAAGQAGLEKVFTRERVIELNARGDRLRQRLQAAADQRDVPLTVSGLGSMLCIHPTHRGPIRRPSDLAHVPYAARKLVHLELNMRGFQIARRGFMSLALPITDAEYDAFAGAFAEILDEHAQVFRGAA